jgi:hypothetical protein
MTDKNQLTLVQQELLAAGLAVVIVLVAVSFMFLAASMPVRG